MDSSMVKIRDRIFVFMCLCMPFLCTPKILNMNFLGGPIGKQLILYPILLFFLYTVYVTINKKNIFISTVIFKRYLSVYIVTLLVSAIIGIFIFPYYDVIFNGPVDQIEKLAKLMDVLQNHHIAYDQNLLIGFWLIGRSIKVVFFQFLYTFFFSYLIYCWYKNNYKKALDIILKSIKVISSFAILYAAIQIFYYTGFELARNILVVINPIVHDIEVGMGWWPPLLWSPARLRAFFPEPSYLGMYIAFALPFLWMDFLRTTRWFSLFLIAMLEIICFLTYSKTAVMLNLGESVLFFCLCMVCKNKDYFKKNVILVLTFLLAFSASGLIGSQFTNSSIKSVKSADYMTQYLESNVSGVTKKESGSNGARFSVIKSELRIWEKYPILGVGAGKRDCYIGDFLTDEEKKNAELANCLKYQEKLGLLKSGFPTPCEYSTDLAELGIVGTLVKLFPFIMLFGGFFKYRKRIFSSSDKLDFITVVIAMIGCVVNGFSNQLTVIYTTWILLGLAFAMLRSIWKQKDEN